jgi:hypothetical protein
MTACTERHFRGLSGQAAGEGEKGMTACAGRRFRAWPIQAAGEGQTGMPEGGAA